MNISNLTKILDSFYSNNKIKSILIDGPWGCGKTYTIKKFINDKNSICYVSLFGIKNVDELNTFIYKTVHTKRIVSKYSFNSISKIVSPLSHTIYAIPNVLQKIEDTENPIIVFDDLERVEQSFSLTELFGYIDKFINNGIRIICCYNKEKLDESKKKSFNFLEKIFDRIFVISETNTDFLRELLPENIDLDFYDFYMNLYVFFGANLRAYIKIIQFYEYLIKNIQNVENNVKKIVLYNISYLIYVIFYFPDTIILNTEGFLKTDKTIYGENIAKRIEYIKLNNGVFDKLNIDCFYALINLFLFDEFNSLSKALDIIQNINSNSKDSENSFISFYLLSDEDKKKYIPKFVEDIQKNTKYFDSQSGRQTLFDVLRYKQCKLNDEEITIICEGIMNSKNSKDLLDDLDCLEIKNNDTIIQELKSKCQIIRNNYFSSVVSDAMNTKDYDKLNKLFLDLRDNYTEMISFLRKLEKENFVLPDLSATITDSQWTYCHKLARNISQSKDGLLKQSFSDTLSKIVDENGNKSESLNDRVDAICNQYGFTIK